MTQHKKRSGQKQQRDIVVIGASSGGVTALLELVKTLPHDFPAPIFVVQHVPADSHSFLPQLMSSVSSLTAKHPKDGDTVEPGVIYVAPPDHHLLVENGKVLVKRGPKENRFRPSVDALFRSAAYSYGPRVIGVVLTGYLDDGTSGLYCIQRLGGVAVVQDPQDAQSPAMPANALEYVEADHVVPLAELGALLVQLTSEQPVTVKPSLTDKELELLKIEITIAKQDNAFEMGIIEKGKPTQFTCPDCHGVMTSLIEGKLIRFRCHTGHAYTISALLSEVTESVESMLYQSMRGLEETTMLLNSLCKHFTDEKQPKVAELFLQKAKHVGKQARVIHKSILDSQSLSGDLQYERKRVKAKPKDL